MYIQNNYILALINSPQLDTLFVLKQSQVNLKKQKMIIKESRINKVLNGKQMYGSNENVHDKHILTTILQRQHINETNPKNKNHAKHSKTKQAQS